MPTSACESIKATWYFVEGETEILALRQHFGIRAKKIGLYGHNVDMAQVARKIAVSLIAEEPDRVFVMFDRESRDQSCDELRADLHTLLTRDFPRVEFWIAIPDRDVESWIFADYVTCSRYFGKPLGKKSRFEGEKGAEKLKSYIGTGRYDKTDDGVKLVGRIKWSRIVERSASAQRAKLNLFFGDCGWLQSD